MILELTCKERASKLLTDEGYPQVLYNIREIIAETASNNKDRRWYGAAIDLQEKLTAAIGAAYILSRSV